MVFEQLFPDIGLYLQLIRFFIVLVLGITATRVILMPATSRVMARRGADIVSTHSFSNIVGISGVFLSFIIALQSADFGGLVTVLGTITAALTVAIGFGMRDQISNLVAGFMLYMDSPFIKGDYIKAGENQGVVQEIKLRHTVIKNGASEKTVLPNSMLTTNPLENYSKGRKATAGVDFTIEAGKAEDLEEIIREELEGNEHILEKPEPEVNYIGLDDGKVSIEVVFSVTRSGDLNKVVENLNSRVINSAVEKGIFDKEE